MVDVRIKNLTMRYWGCIGLEISSAWAGAVFTEYIDEYDEYACRGAEFREAGSDEEACAPDSE